MNVAELIASSGSGMFASITGKNLKEFKVNLPPLPEQKRIVDLISSVDSYIEALQQQLESAKKSRNALLHELLTAGGEDWVETTLGEVALLNPSEPALSVTAHFAPMDAVHVGKRWLQYTEERRDRNGARARAGDVLFARITPCLENGKVAQVQSDLERCGGSTEFIVVRGTEKCTSDFLYFWCTLKVNRDKAAELMTGTTGRQRLSWQGLGSLSLWLPSIAEQERIVHNISEFDSFIESTESAITESQNLRSGLLSDLLSGEHEIPASYDKVIGAA
jgi:type I restriction enzyme S subunit